MLKPILAGNLVAQVLGVIVNVANISQGYIGSSAWGGVFLHAILAAGFGYYYLQIAETSKK